MGLERFVFDAAILLRIQIDAYHVSDKESVLVIGNILNAANNRFHINTEAEAVPKHKSVLKKAIV